MAEAAGSSRDPHPSGVRAKSARPRAETRRPSLFWPIAAIAIPPLYAAARIRVRGGEHLPATGPFVLAPNHLSNIDPVVVGAVVWRLGRAPRFLTKASLFRVPLLGGMLRGVGQIPVERGGRLQRGAVPLEAAKRLIREGQGVIVYPEGSLTRDPDLWPMRGKTGAARLALQLGLPVIPVAHWGAQHLMPVNTTRLTLRPKAQIEVTFGPRVELADLASPNPDGATLQVATDRIMTAITAQLADLRGEPAPPIRWDPSAHNQPDIGKF